MSCSKQAACRNPRAYRIPRSQLDQVRKKLDFSDTSEGAGPKSPPANRYDSFKRISEKHSSHEIIPPMYTSAQLAAVPDSFLDMFQSRIGMEPEIPGRQTRSSAFSPPPSRSPSETEMPASFLEFCQQRLATQKTPPLPRSAPVRTPSFTSYEPMGHSYYVQGSSPYGTSYYGHDMPGAKAGLVFSPKHTSTMRQASRSPPPRSPPPRSPRRSPLTTYGGYTSAAYGNYVYPSLQPSSPVYGLGKYCYPSTPVPTPPTPPEAHRSTGYSSKYESTISSGDIMDSPSHHRSRSRKSSRASSLSPGSPLRHSTPANYLQRHLAPNVSLSGSSVLSARKREHVDTLDLDIDDVLEQSAHEKCPGCPTLGVTPVQSRGSMEHTPRSNKQNISRSIENELSAREAHERSQLGDDLMRWQQARRKLVMNAAKMGG